MDFNSLFEVSGFVILIFNACSLVLRIWVLAKSGFRRVERSWYDFEGFQGISHISYFCSKFLGSWFRCSASVSLGFSEVFCILRIS